MSIIIKGMEMPEDCRACPMCGYEFDIGRTRCIVTCRILAEHYAPITFDDRPDWCPLIELPPHGRLIDADKLMKKIKDVEYKCIMTGQMYAHSFFNNAGNSSVEWWCVEDMVENSPTVLEAEDES